MSYYRYNKDTYIKRQIAENKLKKITNFTDKPVIYFWVRSADLRVYIGQAKGKRFKERSIEHCLSYDHLGKSIIKHGMYSEENPFGWKLRYVECDEKDLDRLEKEYIKHAQELGYTLYNITSGGQDKGKTDINQRESGKNYRDGLKQGYSNAIKEISELFEKYLDAIPKTHDKKKNGEIKEIYNRKWKEFYKVYCNTKN